MVEQEGTKIDVGDGAAIPRREDKGLVSAWWIALIGAVGMLILLPPVGLPGVLVYLRAAGDFPWHVAAGVAGGFALGAFLGARLATRLSGPRLQRLFAGVMVVLALLLFIRS